MSNVERGQTFIPFFILRLPCQFKDHNIPEKMIPGNFLMNSVCLNSIFEAHFYQENSIL